MTGSLISTKLRPSQSRSRLVARPRLTATLQRDAGRRLTLVCAPAGFGKTTLLAEWLEGSGSHEGSVAWVSLDAGDNDPVRFLSYLVAALKTVEGEVGREGQENQLSSPGPVLDTVAPWDTLYLHGTVAYLIATGAGVRKEDPTSVSPRCTPTRACWSATTSGSISRA